MANDAELHYQENFYQLPIDLCCVIDVNSQRISHANSAFETILGWKTAEIVGQKLSKLAFDETSSNTVEKTFSKITLGLHTLTFEMQCQCKSSQQRWISWKCYLDDKTQQFFAIGRDITHYKEIEKLLIKQSNMDNLTGVFGRQTFYTLLQKELDNASRYAFDTAILIINIDHFKEYNYTHGVEKGDECLRQVALTLKASLRRKTDFLARFSNDEFAVLLTHNDLAKALKVGEYLRASLEKLAIQHGATDIAQSITVSIGITATTPENRELTPEQLLNAAIRAMNMSQQRGGNQINYV